jgi:hypothetical protein
VRVQVPAGILDPHPHRAGPVTSEEP